MTDLQAPVRPRESVVRRHWQAWLARWVRRLEQHPPPPDGPFFC